MNVRRNLVLYTSLLIIFGAAIYWLLHTGNNLHPKLQSAGPIVGAPAAGLIDSFGPGVTAAFPILLLQVVLIILLTQLLGTLFRRLGQPAVIGEIVAGILLGPSLLGWVFPGAFQFIFPPASMENLRFLSQIGLLLFMFIIGMELDMKLIRKQAFDALVISHASILIPYTLGIALAFYLYRDYAPTGIPFLPFALFMGIAMSITAFPVLARIIREKGLSETKLGVLAITCAASDDVTAWCVLALLVAFLKSGDATQGLITIAAVLIYAAIMLVPVRLLIKKIYARYVLQRIGYPMVMAILFSMLLLSAYCTEVIGIHALFGAFLAGVIMPRDPAIRERITGRVQDITLVMLLPIFFVFTGLRTQAGLLNTASGWIAFVLILVTAVLGKFGGSSLVAKMLGQSGRDSLALGALMNTRGLVELIVLNIGLDMGILSLPVFTMLVLMALLTTMMTSPVLNRIARR